ncbi:long-chain-fatty-acid--CoA ligase 1 [Diutina catenulata]
MVQLLTVPVGPAASASETAPRRKASQKDGTVDRPFDSKATTVPEFFAECVKRNGDRNAIAWRELIEVHKETKKVTKIIDGKEQKVDKEWTFYEQSPYKHITYPDLLSLVERVSRGLVEIGMKPGQDRMHIYAATSHKWMQTYLACSFQSLTVVTAYDTLGESGLTHSLLQTNSNAIFTDNALIGSLINPLQKATDVRYIITYDAIDASDKRDGGKMYREAADAKAKLLEVRPDLKFYSFDELAKLGANSKAGYTKPKPEDTACLMYTSGSTGDPKGVIITHKMMLCGLGGITTCAGRDLVQNTDRVIAFLPLAHILEMMFELMSFWWGGTLGYANVKTLTDVSVRNSQSDLAEFKPTIMVGVAAVWESVRKGVIGKVKQQPAFAQRIFWAAFAAKKLFTNYHLPGGIFDVVFKKIKQATGGHLRVVLNGGSPISRDGQVFISTLIAPMLIGYGLTESCANTTIVEHQHFAYDTVGTLLGSLTGKLVDVADAGYFAKNNQGELWIKGDCVTSGYYKNEKETKEAFTEDGWFMTGDICEWNADGSLKVIDRKKNLVKTLNGEYIALEKLEAVYRSNSNVLNLCVYADQNRVKPIAIVLPNEAHMKSFLADEGVYSKQEVQEKELAVLCEDPKVVSAVHKSLLQTGKSQGLKGIELLQNIVLLDEEWTPQNGMVTSAQKLQRRKILDSCKDKVEKAYKNS